jgi:hypothetical protein
VTYADALVARALETLSAVTAIAVVVAALSSSLYGGIVLGVISIVTNGRPDTIAIHAYGAWLVGAVVIQHAS